MHSGIDSKYENALTKCKRHDYLINKFHTFGLRSEFNGRIIYCRKCFRPI